MIDSDSFENVNRTSKQRFAKFCSFESEQKNMYSLVSLSIFFILLTNVPSDGEQILRKVAIPAPFPFMRGHSVMTFVPANGTYRMSSAEFARGARNKGSYVRVEGEDGEILRISCNIRFPTQRRVSWENRFFLKIDCLEYQWVCELTIKVEIKILNTKIKKIKVKIDRYVSTITWLNAWFVVSIVHI